MASRNRQDMPYLKLGEKAFEGAIRSGYTPFALEDVEGVFDRLPKKEQKPIDCFIETRDWGKMALMLFTGDEPKIASRKAMDWSRRPKTLAALVERYQQSVDRYYVTSERIIRELSKLAFSNLGDYYTIGHNGEPILDLSKCTPEEKAAMSEITVEDFTEGRGENSRDVRRIKFKLYNKLDAIEKLMKHMQMFAPERFEIAGPGGGPIQHNVEHEMTNADAAAAYALTLEGKVL